MRICIFEIFPFAIIKIVSELNFTIVEKNRYQYLLWGKLNKQYVVTDQFVSKNNAYDVSILNITDITRTSDFQKYKLQKTFCTHYFIHQTFIVSHIMTFFDRLGFNITLLAIGLKNRSKSKENVLFDCMAQGENILEIIFIAMSDLYQMVGTIHFKLLLYI